MSSQSLGYKNIIEHPEDRQYFYPQYEYHNYEQHYSPSFLNNRHIHRDQHPPPHKTSPPRILRTPSPLGNSHPTSSPSFIPSSTTTSSFFLATRQHRHHPYNKRSPQQHQKKPPHLHNRRETSSPEPITTTSIQQPLQHTTTIPKSRRTTTSPTTTMTSIKIKTEESIDDTERITHPTTPTTPTSCQPERIQDIAVRLLYHTVRWARSVPAFTELCVEDQVRLLENSWSDIFVLFAFQWHLEIRAQEILTSINNRFCEPEKEVIISCP